jgi:hypothetical protein
MKLKTMLAVVAVLGGLAFFTARATSQDKPGAQAGGQQPSPEQAKAMQESMQKWMATLQPGEHHKQLEHFVGSWNTTTKIWWGGPGTPAVETKGRSDVKWVLDKRFIMEEHHGEMPMPDETGAMKNVPYKGIGMTGYNNSRNVFESSWTSNLGTEMLTMRGGVDPSGKVFRYYGQMDEPMMDIVGRTVKYVNRIINDDKHVFEIIDLHAGDDYKVIELTYTRR